MTYLSARSPILQVGLIKKSNHWIAESIPWFSDRGINVLERAIANLADIFMGYTDSGGSVMLTLNIQLPEDKLVEFCQRWKVSELALFGSVLREDFRSDSDIDILVTFAPDAKRGLLVLVKMKYELEDLLGREIDLVSKRAIETSHNWIRRNEILETAQVMYVAK
jgi:predicted nucleotidyltransferase